MKETNLLPDTDDTDDDLDLFRVGVDATDDGPRPRTEAVDESVLSFISISISLFAVSTGFAPPNIDDGSAAGVGFESKGTERG